MSVTESKTSSKVKANTKNRALKASQAKTAVAQFVETALVDAPVEIVTLKQLVKTPLNARKTPVPKKEVRELASSIEGAGLLQNLIAVRLSNGQLGVAGGETRRRSLNLLMEKGRSAAGVPVTPDFPVPVKVVDEDKARQFRMPRTDNVPICPPQTSWPTSASWLKKVNPLSRSRPFLATAPHMLKSA